MQENDDGEDQVEGKGGRPGVFDRARGAIGSAKQQVSRSAEVLSGSDIRRFDDFTDAATRAVVGVHRDQAELREHLADMDQTANELRQEQLSVAERLETTEQSVRDIRHQQSELLQRVDETITGLRQEQSSLTARLETTEQSVRDMRQQQSEFLQRVDESPRSNAESLSLADYRVRDHIRGGATAEHRRHSGEHVLMGYEELKTLAESYPPQEQDALFELAQKYRSRDEREILEVAAIAADVSLDDVQNLELEPEADPQFLEAFRLQYPNVVSAGLDSLRGAPDERLDGLANGVKGKYFEVLVRDRLKAGERLGELQLEPGQTAQLAESSTQPGWDLRIVNADGSIDERLQLKATDSMSYVKKALDDYPNIRVVVPSEINDASDEVIGTGISNEQLELTTDVQIGEMSEGAVDDLLDKGAEAAFDSIPLVSMATTGVIEGRNVLTGRSTLRESSRRGARRTGRAAAYDAIGTALGFTGVAVPVVVGLRLTEARVTRLVAFGENLELRTLEIGRLAASTA